MAPVPPIPKDVLDPDIHVQVVTVAFWPIDVVSGRGGTRVKASVPALGVKGVRNLSGHIVFLDLPPGPHEFAFVPGESFLPRTKLFDPGTLPPVDKQHDVRLYPSQSYPFGTGTTQVRGLVEQGGSPADNVAIRRLPDPAVISRTDALGRFALLLRPSTPTEVVTLTFELGGSMGTHTLPVTEGSVHNAGTIVIP